MSGRALPPTASIYWAAEYIVPEGQKKNTWKFGMWFSSFSEDSDIGPFFGTDFCDSKSDTSGASGDNDSFSLEMILWLCFGSDSFIQ